MIDVNFDNFILPPQIFLIYFIHICSVACPVGIFNANEFICQTILDDVDNNRSFVEGCDRIIGEKFYFTSSNGIKNIEMSNVEEKINCKKNSCEFLYIDTVCCYSCQLTFICENSKNIPTNRIV